MAVSAAVIALAGNPNCGKTSLFNYITGSHQHVGNYPGVTVERKMGMVRVDDTMVSFLDLPGTYSLSPYSPEEEIAMNEIISDEVHGIIVVVDTTRLVRNLYLVSQIIETGKPVALALNMFDEFEASGNALDVDCLSELLGVPCIRTVGNRGKGVTELMSVALKAARGEVAAVGKPFSYSHEMEHAIERVQAVIGDRLPFDSRWAAIQLLHFGRETHVKSISRILTEEDHQAIDDTRRHLIEIEGRDINTIITEGRYGFAHGIARECLHENHEDLIVYSDIADRVLTHRWLGIPIFLGILWFMFQATFTLGEYPQHFIEQAFGLLGEAAGALIPPGYFQSLVVDGVIAGVGGVLVFLPNILFLFLFISLLEDTGYMSRAAFIMDRFMHACGLHGKSFIPMLVGFGCTVPAIMATRVLENRRDRYITMFIVPFMSCGARFPVYVLLASAFFSPRSAGNVIFSIYLAGVALAFVVAKILSAVGHSSTPFVMELPPYRIPTLRSVLLHIWERTWMYLRKAGTIILAFSIIMWFVFTFPASPPGTEPGEPARTEEVLAHTFAGKFGKFIEPALKPLGYDWKIGVAITTGFAAKEIVVSTLSTIYAISESPDGERGIDSLRTALREQSGLTPVTAYGLMLFILIYIPCMATLAVLKREAGGWRWSLLMVVYTTSLAWLVAFSFVKIAPLVGLFS
ncbi:ferrous iron transport protein B [Candidatus Latescibacterota bacterium]